MPRVAPTCGVARRPSGIALDTVQIILQGATAATLAGGPHTGSHGRADGLPISGTIWRALRFFSDVELACKFRPSRNLRCAFGNNFISDFTEGGFSILAS